MAFLKKIIEAGRRLDQSVSSATGVGRAAQSIKEKVPPGVRRVGVRYGPFLIVILVVALFAAALSGGGDAPSRITTGAETAGEPQTAIPGEPGGEVLEPGVETAPQTQAQTGVIRPVFPGQRQAPATAGVCGINGILATGSAVQFPYAPQCVDKFTGDNGGDVYRGVFRDKIRVVFMISNDPTIRATTAAAGGCSVEQYESCTEDYVRAYNSWFAKYYETYGRQVEVVKFVSSGREADATAAIQDARRIAGMEPKVFAVLGGYAESGAAFPEELKAHGIVCFCTVSLPQEKYEDNAPFIWSNLMSSTQAYIHRAEYIGKRLWGKPAKYAGPALRNKTRVFGMVWFDNSRGDYRPGIEFFDKHAAQYGVSMKIKIRYEEIAGCQRDSPVIIRQLLDAGVTSVFLPTDPICIISLTEAAQAQQAQWEWVMSGAVLQDTNNFGRLYQQDQWARAFGVSMLSPDVKNASDYWYKMYKEVRPNKEPLEDAPLGVAPFTMLYTGIHLGGPKLNPTTFRDGMAKAIPSGGSVTLPKQSWGPKTVVGYSFWDYLRLDDMTEVFWDPNAVDPNGRARAYRYVDGGKRWAWGTWPSTDPKVFLNEGTVTGYDKPPDQ